MDYTYDIFQFKDRCFYDDDNIVVFSDKEEKLQDGTAIREAKLYFFIDEYDNYEDQLNCRKTIFANSIDEVEFIVSAFSHLIFTDVCDFCQGDSKAPSNAYTAWRNAMKNYTIVELTRCNNEFELKRIYGNVFDFLGEQTDACAGAHAHNVADMVGGM